MLSYLKEHTPAGGQFIPHEPCAPKNVPLRVGVALIGIHVFAMGDVVTAASRKVKFILLQTNQILFLPTPLLSCCLKLIMNSSGRPAIRINTQ